MMIAATVGCEASYVAQVLSVEENQEKVAVLRLEKAQGMIEHDTKIGDLEKDALEKMGRLLPMQTDIMKVSRIFQVLNGAKKSADQGLGNIGRNAGAVVELHLPAAAHVHFRLTSDQQVIEVEGRSMVPMPSHMVAAKLKEQQALRLLENSTPRSAISDRTKSIVDQL